MKWTEISWWEKYETKGQLPVKIENVNISWGVSNTHFIHFLFESGKHLIAFCQRALELFKPPRVKSKL